MIEFIYKEFKRNIGAFPIRSLSFIVSFMCTYFILLVAVLFVRNVFESFEVLSEDYKTSLVLRPDFEEIEIKNLSHKIAEISPNIRVDFVSPKQIFENLKQDNLQLNLTDQEIIELVPAVAELRFSDMGPLHKVQLTKDISDWATGVAEIDQVISPYPTVQKLVDIYHKNRVGIWGFITALYTSIFVLLFLLLSLSLKEHKNKTNLLKILGFPKNFIRGPLILEGVFLSAIGLIFAISILFAVWNQLQQEYSEVINIPFFSMYEIGIHLLVNVSLVFFLTTLMTQKIIREDYVENQ
ncbi:MAG: hypothetical protein M9899_01840 [Bdellovibrionaceae bacterium]|nr:hypothetical protein [Pseudobdellovibrionaceae bacterium]